MLYINYATGQMKNVISDDVGMKLLQNRNINHIKFFWHSIDQLRSVTTYIDDPHVIIAFQNEEMELISNDKNVGYEILKPYQEFNNILDGIAIGNEVDQTQMSPYMIVNAMRNIYEIKQQLNLKCNIITPLTMGIFGWERITPPSDTQIQDEWKPIIQFLNDTQSLFMINIHPYLSWLNHKDLYNLDYALGNSNYFDGKYMYTSLFDQQIDAVLYALENSNYKLNMVIGETGWPTDGGEETTIDNSYKYLKYVSNRQNTPAHPNVQIPFYWFETFDEFYKPGLLYETYYGIFTGEGQYKFSN